MFLVMQLTNGENSVIGHDWILIGPPRDSGRRIICEAKELYHRIVYEYDVFTYDYDEGFTLDVFSDLDRPHDGYTISSGWSRIEDAMEALKDEMRRQAQKKPS